MPKKIRAEELARIIEQEFHGNFDLDGYSPDGFETESENFLSSEVGGFRILLSNGQRFRVRVSEQ